MIGYTTRFRLFLGIFVCLFFIQNSRAQDNHIGNWFIYFGNQKINDKWNWNNEIQYRNYNFIGNLQQLLIRTGLGYDLTENNNNVSLGYAYINSHPYIDDTDEKGNVNEHRIFQQFITRQNFGRVFIQHRYRLEERFIEGNYSTRARYFLALNVPFNAPIVTEKTIYFSAYNEIFLNFESPVFDRDRLFGGLGYGISKDLRFELGMMYQIFETTNRPQFQIILFNNIPFRKSVPK